MQQSHRSLLFLFLFLVIATTAFVISTVSAAGSVSSAIEDSESSVMVSECRIKPETLMCNDIGTVTVTVKNTGLHKSVNIKKAQMLSNDVTVLSDSYFGIGRLGPKESLNLSFTIKATCPEGIYYPKLLVEAEDAQNIRYSFPVTVDSSSLTIGVTDVPEDIFKGDRAKIELAVGNPRSNTVSAVKIVTTEPDVVPSEIFIGALSADESKVASFNFTPQSKGDYFLNFELEFKNGDNYHSADLSVPLNVTESKKSAELILTGIEVESMPELDVYKITGDINNAGLEGANSVVMKIDDGEGIVAVHPYKAYFVGLLSADDFSSFELNVKVNDNEKRRVPVLIEYKDEDGSLFSKIEYVSIEPPQKTTSSGELPVSLILVLCVVAIGIIGLIAYSWKKR